MRRLAAAAAALMIALSAQAAPAAATAPAPAAPLKAMAQVQAAPAVEAEGEILVPEDRFLSMLAELSINRAKYLGRAVRIAGMFDWVDYGEAGNIYRVFRYSCKDCGLEAQAHMDLQWDGALPERFAWTEAVGTLEEYELFGSKYLRLAVTELKPAQPGLQYVVN